MRFEIDPIELNLRRRQIRAQVDQLAELPRETVIEKYNGLHVLATRDRYGLPFRVAIQMETDLVVMLDRFTPEGYKQFYAQHYRPLVAAFNRAPHTDVAFLERGQRTYACSLVAHLRDFVNLNAHDQILDIGGSTGVITSIIAESFGGRATVIDPAINELEAAKSRGIRVVHDFIETWSPDQEYDLVLLCRSIEHVYDLDATLTKVRDLLAPSGLFFVDIVDFLASCRSHGAPEAVSRVDHCYWLSYESAEQYFARCGFKVMATFDLNVYANDGKIGYLLKKSDPFVLSVNTHYMVNEIKVILSSWHKYQTTRSKLFRIAYKAYKRFLPSSRK